MNDAVVNKKESIERCILQIRTYYAMPSELPFEKNFLQQDAISANLIRACELCIDLANIVVRKKKLGVPKESRDSFRLLRKEKIIPPIIADRLVAMVGFRNTLVHQYQDVDMKILIDIIENHLDELVDFTNIVMNVTDVD
ncbi:DUF86 domain-containing protein [candidate division KSB1 bacterium]|nr:DUF86 domain-containing protein [candidate division KSB1 bacterium]